MPPRPNIKQLLDAMDDLKKKRRELETRLLGADREQKQQLAVAAKGWLQKVGDIEAEVAEIEGKLERKSSSCTCFGGGRGSGIHRIASVKYEAVKQLCDEGDFAVIPQTLPVDSSRDLPVQNIYADESNLDKILRYLNRGERIIGIHGDGGVGKTTLLKNISKALTSGDCKFDHVLWVVVSKAVNLERLQEEIVNRLGLHPEEHGSMEQVISNFLKNKNFVLLLDDLKESVDLDEVGFPDHRKVVFTTRSEDVCQSMGAHKTVKVECLNSEDSWLVFREKVGDELIGSSSSIESVAKDVAKECGGLPLALIIVGRSLSASKTAEEWREALDTLKKSQPIIVDLDGPMFHLFKFGFDKLQEDAMRQCFLSCALFPEDYSIRRDELIECFMGHGFVNEQKFDDICEAYKYGQFVISSLISACWLEEGDNPGTTVKMHDVLRDFALWTVRDGGKSPSKWVVFTGVQEDEAIKGASEWKETERLSIMRSDVQELPLSLAKCAKLKTIMLRWNTKLEFIPRRFFQSFPALTVLDLSGTRILEFPEEITTLSQLEYLNLSHTRIRSLSRSLVRLTKLRFLLLHSIRFVVDIPYKVISNIPALRVLDLFKSRLTLKVANIEELSPLNGRLAALGITIKSVYAVQNLVRVVGDECIWRLQMKGLKGRSSLGLSQKLLGGGKNLQNLSIEWCFDLETLTLNGEDTQGGSNAESWIFPRLEVLELEHMYQLKAITVNTLAPAVRYPCLRRVQLDNCYMVKNISGILQLPYVEYLRLYKCNELEQIVNVETDEDYSDGKNEDIPLFSTLKELELIDLPKLRGVSSHPIDCPSLEKIKVKDCPNLKRLTFNFKQRNAEVNSVSLECEKAWWSSLRWDDKSTKSSLVPNFQDTWNWLSYLETEVI